MAPLSLIELLRDPAAKAILADRGRLLARMERDDTTGSDMVWLSFRLGSERYSLPASALREVHTLPSLTPLPETPAYILGIVHIRGRLMCVIDLRALRDRPVQAPAAGAMVLVLGSEEAPLALLADEVLNVSRDIPQLHPLPLGTAGRDLAWIVGVDPSLQLHLDPQLLLHDERLIAQHEAEPT